MQERVRINNKRSLRLSAIIDRPQHQELCPAVVVLHGFTGFKEEEHISDFAVKLAAAGIAAIRFDASGFGNSEGTVEADFRVSHYLDDIKLALQHLSQLDYVDAERIGICGHSLGGGLAIITAAQEPAIKTCCAVQPSRVRMAEGSPYDLVAWEKSGWLEMECAHPKYSTVRIPWEFALDRNQHDSAQAAAKLNIPFMLMYGTSDSTVPPQVCLSIFEQATCPKELIALEGYEHDFRLRPDERRHVTNLLVDFFQRQL